MAALSRPNNRVTRTYRDYLEGTAWRGPNGKPMPLLAGKAFKMLDRQDDLVALRQPADEDVVSKFLQDHWAFQKRQTFDKVDRTTIYQKKHVAWTVAALSISSAIVLLVVAITSLYNVQTPTLKLGLVVLYTTLFALTTALFTTAKRTEVFAVTAAYAAVLVVFISGNLGRPLSSQCMQQLGNGLLMVVDCPG
jgi:hypothetical protein